VSVRKEYRGAPTAPNGGREWLTAMIQEAVSHLQPGDREGHKYVVGYLLSHCSLAPKEALEVFDFIDRNGKNAAPAGDG